MFIFGDESYFKNNHSLLVGKLIMQYDINTKNIDNFNHYVGIAYWASPIFNKNIFDLFYSSLLNIFPRGLCFLGG